MILVTGGTGLVGAHLLLHLSKNEDSICAIYRNENHIEKTKSLFTTLDSLIHFSKINWIKADILDVPSLENAFENIDFVYHCAAKISFDPDDEDALRKTNIEGTANIVNFCIAKKVKKLCHVSSIAALGEPFPDQKIINETNEWNPEKQHSDYAISKYGAEMEVWRAHQEGLAVVIVNPAVIFGIAATAIDWKNGSGAFFIAIKKGFPFYTKGITGYVSVNDVVKIMMLLMKAPINGERFILVSENRTYKDIIATISKKIGAKNPTLNAKPWILNIAWRIDWIFTAIFRSKRKISKQSALALQSKIKLSNEKIVSHLNYSFEPIDDCLDSITHFFLKSL
ncbi:MAG: NAD-dependent epimerase/dehydratase family protein [Flavobacterium sp.]|nr:NAD-dependent epimerase/dehydratase family protein [Flavobacterium sp.]